MKTLHNISSLFLILIGVVFCVSSLNLGTGGITNPGPGLAPFLVGSILILFSIGTIIEYNLKGDIGKAQLFSWKKWRTILFVLFCLFAYALVLDSLGFVLSTFLLLTCLFKASEGQRWVVALAFSTLTTILCYLLFVYFLMVSFPRGFLGF